MEVEVQIERPEKPQGRHVTLLRHYLGFNQTWFAALLETAQTSISHWEHVDKREEELTEPLTTRFLEVWDCFPTRPAGGFTEAMATVSAYRMRKAGAVPADLPPGFVVLSYPEGKTGPRVLIEETGQRPPEGQPPLPRVGASTQEVAQRKTSGATSASAAQASPNAGGRSAVAFALAASFACFTFATGCLFSHRDSQEPVRMSAQIDPDNATNGNGDMGTAQERSIQMPQKAYSWQKFAPCTGGEIEKVGGCWEELTREHPPCPYFAVESEGTCFLPIPARPKKPNTITPEK